MATLAIDLTANKKYLIKNTSLDFHTANGSLAAGDLKKSGRIKSNKNQPFLITDLTLADFHEVMARGPQIIIHKDIGMILAKTGLNNAHRVVDAGGGSGALCLALANVAKEVVVYELNPEHYDVIQKNIKLLNITNVILKQQDVYKGIDETELDLITFDLPEPHQALAHAAKSLKEGGHLIIYQPNLTQVQEFLKNLKGSKLKLVEILELIERKWKIEDKIMRPEFEMLGHTGFLVFCRKW